MLLQSVYNSNCTQINKWLRLIASRTEIVHVLISIKITVMTATFYTRSYFVLNFWLEFGRFWELGRIWLCLHSTLFYSSDRFQGLDICWTVVHIIVIRGRLARVRVLGFYMSWISLGLFAFQVHNKCIGNVFQFLLFCRTITYSHVREPVTGWFCPILHIVKFRFPELLCFLLMSGVPVIWVCIKHVFLMV